MAWVVEAKEACPASKLCDVVALERRTYYDWKNPSTRTLSPAALEAMKRDRKPYPRLLSLEQEHR